MRTRLFIVFSALSLLLFVAVVGMWARSGYHCDALTITAGGVERTLYSQWHSLYYVRTTGGAARADIAYGHAGFDRTPALSPLGHFRWTSHERLRVAVPWLLLALAAIPLPVVWAIRQGIPNWTRHVPWLAIHLFAIAEVAGSGDFFSSLFGYWFFATIMAVVLLLVLDVGRGAWKLSNTSLGHGLCPACGYDLRATPERCPECGRLGAEASP